MKKILSFSIITLSVLFFGCKKTAEFTKSVDPASLASKQTTLASSAWEQLPSFPEGRIGAFGFSIGNKGYIGSGVSSNGFPADFVEFDPTTNKWTKKGDFPGGSRYGAVSFTIGNKGYLCLGNSQSIKDLWEYEPATDKWSRKADLPLSSTLYSGTTVTGFSIGNKGYVGVFCGSLQLYEYNPEQDVWTKKAELSTGNRTGAIAFSIGNKGYVGLGIKLNKDQSNTFMNDLWEYNPETNAWTRKADFPGGGRGAAVAFTINDKGYVGAGISSHNYIDSAFKNDLWQYDSVDDTWTLLDLTGLTGRSQAVGFSIGNSGYIGVGFNLIRSHYSCDFERFSVE